LEGALRGAAIINHKWFPIVAGGEVVLLFGRTTDVMTRQQVLDLYFMDARSKLIDLAAFLDRVERAEGKDDFRLKAFRDALKALSGTQKEKAKQVLLAFSDPSTEPIAKAAGKGAVGAWPGAK
jgi:hypothetical protein